jgi:protein-tyrosine phosphatase
MLNLFRKKNVASGFSFLHTDLHSHLIPGIDDGAKTMDDSLHLVRQLYDLGYRHVITTPHVMADLYPNTPKDITDGLAALRVAVSAAGIDIELDAAAEYFMDEHFSALVEHDQLLTLPGNRVLVEMSMMNAPPNLFNDLFRLQTKGYAPVLAHPERYLFLKQDFRQYTRLKDYGCEFQLNLLSVTGYYGKPVREAAIKLLKNNMINFLGTDLHHTRHAQALSELAADRSLMKLLTKYEYTNPILSNPVAIQE